MQRLLIGLAITLANYAAAVVALALTGRRQDALAFARFVPDCLVLFRRLVADPRVSRPRKLVVLALIGYLASPIDLIPDFIPVRVGQLDDALLTIVVLRGVLRSAGSELLQEHWPGPTDSLSALTRLAGGLPV